MKEVDAAQKLQGGARGFLTRNAISAGEQAVELHLEVLQEVESLATAAAKSAADDDEDQGDRTNNRHFLQLEGLIGREAQREYLHELETKKQAIMKEIKETESGRYYLAAAEQKKVTKRVKLMKEQLAETSREARLVKSQCSASNTSAQPTEANEKGPSYMSPKARKASLAEGEKILANVYQTPLTKQPTNLEKPKDAVVWPFLRACSQKRNVMAEERTQGVPVRVHLLLVSTDGLGGSGVQSSCSTRAYPQGNGASAAMALKEQSSVQQNNGPIRAQVELLSGTSFGAAGNVGRRLSTMKRKSIDKLEIRERTAQVSIAKLHPQGREAAIRNCLMRTEIWRASPKAFIRQMSELRTDMEFLDLQIQLANRAIARTDRELAKPHSSRIGGMTKYMAKLRSTTQRRDLLKRYQGMLVATRDVMRREVHTTRRFLLRSALNAKREYDAEQLARYNAALCVQSAWRSRQSRRLRNTLVNVSEEQVTVTKTEQKRQQAVGTWQVCFSAIAVADHSQKMYVSAAKIQRLIRERKWQREAKERAEANFQTMKETQMRLSDHLTSTRFAAQRVRLLQREEEYQEQLPEKPKKTTAFARAGVATRPYRSRVVETEQEMQARKALVIAHAHRATQYAQQQPRSESTAPVHDAELAPPPSMPTVRQNPLLAPRPPASNRRPATARVRQQRYSHRPVPATARPATARPSSKAAPAVSTLTDLALRRQTWVQTDSARAFIESAAAEAMRPHLNRMAAQAVGSGAQAAVTLARRACEEPPKRLPQAERLQRKDIFVSPRQGAVPTSTTSRIAAMWIDSSFAAANAKERRAMYEKWRASRRAWIRSSGLRREVLLEEEARREGIHHLRQRDVAALHKRMFNWQRHDDAAIVIQLAWRKLCFRRKQEKTMAIAMKLEGIKSTATGFGFDKVQGKFSRLLERGAPAVEEEARSEDEPGTVLLDQPSFDGNSEGAQSVPWIATSLVDFESDDRGLSEILQSINDNLDAVMTPFLKATKEVTNTPSRLRQDPREVPMHKIKATAGHLSLSPRELR